MIAVNDNEAVVFDAPTNNQSAKIVIPGLGKLGGTELFDYTKGLFKY